MTRLAVDADRYQRANTSPLVEAILNMVRDRVRRNAAETELDWQSLVAGNSDALLSKEDVAAIEQAVLDSGYRFAWSASISVAERPDAYQQDDNADQQDFSFTHPDAVVGEPDASGRQQCGGGDNVVRYPGNVNGVARYIRTNERVLDYLTNGVPANTIAVIDDSGGTLTAPILEYFDGVICAGGTVRSHLGILTREYGIPCLMNAKISGIKDGDLVEIEACAPAKTAEDYQEAVERVACVWRLAEEKK